jgi:hypothetical protein
LNTENTKHAEEILLRILLAYLDFVIDFRIDHDKKNQEIYTKDEGSGSVGR